MKKSICDRIVMRRGLLILGSCILMAAFLLTGCGLQSVVSMDEPSEPAAQSTNIETAPEPADQTPVTEAPSDSDVQPVNTEEPAEPETQPAGSEDVTAPGLEDAETPADAEDEPEPSPEEAAAEETAADTQDEAQTEALDAEAGEGSPSDVQDEKTGILVSTVDEFLAALEPGATITLAEGNFDLSTASDYGENLTTGFYTWEESYDGFQLVIHDADHLTIKGRDENTVTISAVPRYSNVLTFRNCQAISLSQFTAGHTQEPGYCAGGVLDFLDSSEISVDHCKLFGCGVLGISANNCRELRVTDSEIYECSYGAVSSYSCYDFVLADCVIRDCGKKDDMYNCFSLFETSVSTGFVLVNCAVTGNDAAVLLKSSWSQQTALLGCEITNNQITESVFNLDGASPVVEGCAFTGNDISMYYPEHFNTYAVSAEGEDLITFDFEHMQHSAMTYDGPVEPETVEVPRVERADGSAEYHVTTVDEFLEAIGPNRTVYLDGDLFELSASKYYGVSSSAYYRWEAGYEGPGLVICNLSDFHLIGQGKSVTSILTTSVYADVIRFESCERISVSNLTAGHKTIEPCAGDVLSFSMVDDLTIDGCGLFGCGMNGLSAWQCQNIAVLNCEIYSCSCWAVDMTNTSIVEFSGMDIHDMPSAKNVYLSGCENISSDGRPLEDGEWNLMF